MEELNDEQEGMAVKPHRRHTHPESERGRFFALRQALNLLFMLIAIVGVVIYVTDDEMRGIIVVIIAMAFKMAECVLRYVK